MFKIFSNRSHKVGCMWAIGNVFADDRAMESVLS